MVNQVQVNFFIGLHFIYNRKGKGEEIEGLPPVTHFPHFLVAR